MTSMPVGVIFILIFPTFVNLYFTKIYRVYLTFFLYFEYLIFSNILSGSKINKDLAFFIILSLLFFYKYQYKI